MSRQTTLCSDLIGMRKALEYQNYVAQIFFKWRLADCIFACFALYLSIACYPFLLSNNQAEPLTFLQEYYLLATQFGWLGFIALPLMLGCLLLSFLPTRMFRVVVITFAFALLIVLKVDILVFQQYKLHINGLLIRMFFEGGRDVFEISWMSWLFLLATLHCSPLVWHSLFG